MIKITEEDFVLEIDTSIKEDFREFCIVIKQTKKDGQHWKKATQIKAQIMQGQRLLDLVKNTTIDMTSRERSLLDLLLKQSRETLTQESQS